MANDRQRTSYRLDLDKVAEAVREMNSSRVAVAADWLLHNAFPDLNRALDPETIEERVLLVDGLWRTRLFMDEGASDRIAANLAKSGPGLLSLLSDLEADDLEAHPTKVYDVARQALPVILEQVPNSERRYTQHYSFAAKFFHWCTRCHFPIVDGNARQAINAMQNRHEVRPVVRRDTAEMGGLTYVAEYERWIHFYSDLISGLSAIDRERLLKVDHDSLPGRYCYKNSLLRILDKYFWWRGSRGSA